MPNKNVFEDLGWIDSFILNVFIDLSLDRDEDLATDRTVTLIDEARKLLVESDLDADALYAEWLKQEEDYEEEDEDELT